MKKSAKLWLRVLALALAMLLLGSSTVFAADMDDVPYYSYCYWEGPSRTVAVPMRTMYEATQQITSESLGLLDLYNAAVENDGVDPTYGVITNDPSKIEAVWSHIMMSPDMSELYALDGNGTNGRIFVIDAKTSELKRIVGDIALVAEEYSIAAYQDVTLTANTDYVLTFYTRRDSGKNAYAAVVIANDEIIASESFDHEYDFLQEWVEHQVTFNTGAATDVRLQFESESDTLGGFYVDAVTLVATGSDENLIANGEFSEGVKDWTVGLGAAAADMGRHVEGLEDKAIRLTNYLSYAGAKGIYVCKDTVDANGNAVKGDLMICDTAGNRLLIVSNDGELKRIITRPTGIEIPENLVYTPTRVVMDEKGYIYLSVGEACYHGLLVYDSEFNFKGFHGAYKASSDIMENLTGFITGLFMTNEKAAAEKKNFATGFLDIAIDPDGMLYALSDPKSNTGQIKRMGLNGNQTLNFKSGFTTQSGDLLNFVEQPKTYYEKGGSFVISANLLSLAVDPQGFIYAADSLRGRVYVYDEECRVMSAFGLGFSEGDQLGTYHTPCALAVSDDKLYVADSGNRTITVFELTEYGQLYKTADTHTINGEYELALPYWEQILKLDSNNQRAYEGLAKAYLGRGDYEQAMYYAEMGNDQQTYSLAYSEVQSVWLSNNFWWLFIVCLLAVGAVAAILVISKKRKVFEIKNLNLRTALRVPFSPFESFNAMKTHGAVSLGLGALFVLVFYLARVSQDLYGGFMYVIVDKANYNSLFTLFGSVGILLLWVVTNWGICMLFEGKGSFKEVFCMSAYSMMPMIVYSLIFIVGSHFIPATATDTFGIISTVLLLYTFLLLLIGMTIIHEYTFFKALGMAILTVLGMALVVFVLCAVVLLSQQFIVFIVGIFEELRVR